MGLRFAFARHARDAGSISTPLVGVVLIAATLVAAVTFGRSFDALLDEPARWGTTYELGTGQGGVDAVPEAVQRTILEDPDVDGLTLLGGGSVNVGSESLELTGFDEVRGDLAVDLHEGALPTDEDDLVLGELDADRLGVGVGDTLEVDGGTGPWTFAVSGIAVVPSNVQGGEGLGRDGLVTVAGLRAALPGAQLTSSAISVRPGADVEAVRARLTDALGVAVGIGDPPTVIVNYARVRAAPWQVALLLGVLGLLSVANLLMVTVNRRGHDVAVLHSLGADRRWVARTEHWHALAVSVVIALAGALLGVVVGRVLFRWRVSERVGASPVDVVPVALLGVGALALFLVADLVGQVALRWRRRSIAERLAAE
jgi:hypothetical protein